MYFVFPSCGQLSQRPTPVYFAFPFSGQLSQRPTRPLYFVFLSCGQLSQRPTPVYFAFPSCRQLSQRRPTPLVCILPSLPVGNFHDDDLLLPCVFCLPFLWATFTTTTYSSRVYFAFPSCGQLSRRRPTPRPVYFVFLSCRHFQSFQIPWWRNSLRPPSATALPPIHLRRHHRHLAMRRLTGCRLN